MSFNAPKFSISIFQTRPLFLKTEENLRVIEKGIRSCRSDLMIFPELATSGYNFQKKTQVRKSAEDGKKGKLANLLKRLSREKNAALVVGFPEVKGGALFNSALIATPRTLTVYRKIHLFFNEKKFFKPGRKPAPVLSHAGVRIGTMICFDWFFPEVARSLALKGADVIAHPSNLVMPYAPAGMKTRSLENGVFSCTANRVGTEGKLTYIGLSQICGIRGQVLDSLGSRSPGILTAQIDPREARSKQITKVNNFFKDRRPALYR